jgi:hypothetical protein
LLILMSTFVTFRAALSSFEQAGVSDKGVARRDRGT